MREIFFLNLHGNYFSQSEGNLDIDITKSFLLWCNT